LLPTLFSINITTSQVKMKYIFGSPLLLFVVVGSPTTTTAYIEDSMMRKPSSPSYGTTEWSPKSFLPKVSIRPLGETPPDEDKVNLDDIIRTEYHKWSIRHGKVKEAERFVIFKQNFALQMESNRNTGEFFLLNEFGDLTVDEYESMIESSQLLTTAETEEYSEIVSPVVPNAMDIDSLNINDLVQLQQEDFSFGSPMVSATTNMNTAVVSDKPSIIEESPSIVVEEEGSKWDQFTVSEDTPSIIEDSPSIDKEEGSRWDSFSFAMDFADEEDDDNNNYDYEENYNNIAHVVDLNEEIEHETEDWAEENHANFEVVHEFPTMNSRSTISLTNPPSMVPISNTVISSSQWQDTAEEEPIFSNNIKSTSRTTTTSATAPVSRTSFFTKLNGPSKAALAFIVAPLVAAAAASTTRIPFSVKRNRK
jgi:hypothetical protein